MEDTDMSDQPSRKIISLDCESNGLHGRVFAVAATVQVDGHETETWIARCPIDGEVDKWVAENVIPEIDGIPITYTWEGMLADWRDIYATLKQLEYAMVCHVPWPVETQFLWEAHKQIPFSGPFPIIDVASLLVGQGVEDPTMLDAWLSKRGHQRRSIAHHPLDDARQAAIAYWELTQPPI